MSPKATTNLLNILNTNHEQNERQLSRLTKKEMEVARQIAKGSGYKQVAAELGISYHAVSFHIRNIYSKFKINSQGELVYLLNLKKLDL